MLAWFAAHLWGTKTTAIFDLWSIQHVASGIAISSAVVDGFGSRIRNVLFPGRTYLFRYADLLGVLCLAYLWEAVEYALESGQFGSGAAHWYRGIEFWPNRFIADALLLVLGYIIARRYPRAIAPAFIFATVWIVSAVVMRTMQL